MANKTPNYNTMTFCEVYTDVETFMKDYQNSGLPQKIKDESARITYFLLLARYANNPIANRSIEQFKNKLFSIVFQYGPTWEKRLEIQDKLRNLSDEELRTGSKQIYNHAFNDAGDPTEQSEAELPFINDQNTTNFKRSKIDAYAALWEVLRVDVSENYIRQFMSLFKTFVRDENPVLYCDGECNECEEVVDIYGN